ncbi:WecB/TagA/CpsF family glycosyltransferase [Gilvibacter sediminis]|uniref:WecB/TagA/CpsF family glycosyltransferase n=1 Tax=Gilvibacter sediminis TaxID=379071 RepID=UPI002350A89F|nr:WecB/TagA/CpsF family glycosyltransferase [Gilvibacter sediminis]MDC7996782.1 WecB/TagA/CpsF family glycosyltransferase [Gilvibacter sediminis]
MTARKIHMLNTQIHNLDMEQTLALVDQAIADRKQIHHVAVNAGKIVKMQSDAELRESVNNSDLINADGQAVIWASKFLNQPLKERVAGIDLMGKLVELAHQKNYKIYLFGAKEDVVSKVVSIYKEKYGEDLVAGYRNGYFSKQDEPQIAADIAASGAQILFVAITSPIKENFLYQNREALAAVNMIMGVGGSFDVVAGVTKRAPLWMQNSGLEWFYRFLQEPGRMWKRYLVGNFKFIVLVLTEKFRGKPEKK